MNNIVVKVILISLLLILPTTIVLSSNPQSKPTSQTTISVIFTSSELNTPKLILLPSGTTFKDIKITQHRYQEESSEKPNMIFHTQSNFISYTNNNIISEPIYDQPYQCELLKKGNFDVLRIFVPETYYSSSNKYTTTTITFEIQTAPKQTLLVTQSDLTNIRPFIENPDVLDGFETQYDPQATNYEYVIITNETLWDTFNTNFKSWKITNDYKINDIFIINISSILANSSYWVNGTYGDGTNESNGNPFIPDGYELTSNWSKFNDTQAKIRNFIRAYYTNNATRYVLLGGGFETVPVRYVSTHASGDGCGTFDSDLNHSCDMYYSNLHYNMNNDTNDYWMLNPCCDMTFDLIDWGIELYVGRVPVTTIAQANDWINKTKSFTNGNTQGNYLSRNIVAARDNGNSITNDTWYNLGGEYSASLGDEFSSNQTFVDNQNISSANWSSINDFCNGAISGWDGITILLPAGHGSICGGLFWDEYQPSTLNNTDTPNFVYSESCFVGEYGTPDACCVKSWMRDTNCTFAAIANSAYGWFGASTYFVEEMMRQMFNDSFGVHNMTFCTAHAAARELQGYSTADGVWAMIFKETNFMGDPALDWVWYTGNSFDGTYYGYGDSIMNATGGDLNPDGSDCFVVYMQETYDPTNSSEHNGDGGGKTSSWGLSNFASHVTDMDNCVIEEFGINDWWVGTLTSTQSAQNKLDMYNFSVENNSEDHYYPCINILSDPSNGMRPWQRQCDRINATRNLFINYSVRFIPLYDALDANSWNGVQDYWYNNSKYIDYVHPNKAGHEDLGNFTWFFVNHSDYTETRGAYTVSIVADYNETIYVYPLTGWDLNNVTVLCITNDTEMTWTEGIDIEGNTTIQFSIQKGSSYSISEESITPEFITIENGYNHTNIETSTPTFNWTLVAGTAQYWLQIATDSAFSSLAVNLSNITAFNFPSHYSSNSTRVSFTLPTLYELPYPNKYYCRVKAYSIGGS